MRPFRRKANPKPLMAANTVDLAQNNSCKLCELSGPFEPSDRNREPIEEIVRAVGVKYLPWEGMLQDADQYELTTLWSEMDAVWQKESVINLKRDEIGVLDAGQAEIVDRANRAEDDISGMVR